MYHFAIKRPDLLKIFNPFRATPTLDDEREGVTDFLRMVPKKAKVVMVTGVSYANMSDNGFLELYQEHDIDIIHGEYFNDIEGLTFIKHDIGWGAPQPSHGTFDVIIPCPKTGVNKTQPITLVIEPEALRLVDKINWDYVMHRFKKWLVSDHLVWPFCQFPELPWINALPFGAIFERRYQYSPDDITTLESFTVKLGEDDPLLFVQRGEFPSGDPNEIVVNIKEWFIKNTHVMPLVTADTYYHFYLGDRSRLPHKREIAAAMSGLTALSIE